jgi:hypothetical protein
MRRATDVNQGSEEDDGKKESKEERVAEEKRAEHLVEHACMYVTNTVCI